MASQEPLPQPDVEISPTDVITNTELAQKIETARGRLMEILALKDKTSTAVSPATESRIRALLRQWGDIPPIVDSDIASRWAEEIDRRLIELEKRHKADVKYAPAFARLQDLEIMVFQLRYSDYMPWYKNHPYTEAKGSPLRTSSTLALPLQSHEAEEEALAFFETEEWSAIHSRLVAENGAVITSEFPTNPMTIQPPMVRLIQRLAALNKTKAIDIFHSIRVCSEGRHSYVVYKHYFPFDIDSEPMNMLSRIQKDLAGLSSTPPSCYPDTGAIRDAIFQVANRYFEIFIWLNDL